MVAKNSNQGGLRLDERKVQMDYLKAIHVRYQKVSKPQRSRILDEFCQVCQYNRKYAIRLLNGPAPQKPKTIVRQGVGGPMAPRRSQL